VNEEALAHWGAVAPNKKISSSSSSKAIAFRWYFCTENEYYQ
jgi:hypothetical protein